jgi:CheY-like chemotaxis protein
MSELTPEPTPVGVLLCDDLIFVSRVTGTARNLGLTVKAARSTAGVQSLIQQQTPTCVIVDLHNAGLDIAALVKELNTTCDPRPFVVGYGSHVAAAVLKAAREAGCDLVLPRSKFVEDLPQELPQWLRKTAGHST